MPVPEKAAEYIQGGLNHLYRDVQLRNDWQGFQDAIGAAYDDEAYTIEKWLAFGILLRSLNNFSPDMLDKLASAGWHLHQNKEQENDPQP